MNPTLQSIREELDALGRRGLRRTMRTIDGAQAAALIVDGRTVTNFSSNNYLGLANHPLLHEAAGQVQGFGAGGSRLIVGNLAEHRAFEARVCEWKQTAATLLFNSGYNANIGLVSGLLGPEDEVFSDELNHASLIDGCRLARAQLSVFRHNDVQHLEQFLQARRTARRRLILTESVFSMDGDRAPIPALSKLARSHGALLAVDEAHAVGVLGDAGEGLSGPGSADLQIGTLGKALGAFGAYVTGNAEVIELLRNRARSFVFTTALPSPVVAAARAAIDWLATPEGCARRARLQTLGDRLNRALSKRGFAVGAPSHIVPLRVRDGEPLRAVEASQRLLARGIFAQGIRPPTVPEGGSRIRLALMATHTDAQIDQLMDALTAERELFE